ncbi:MAG TPA: hypothetical protein VFH66_16370 [Mycobacteriales bacterium]|nr:hypothetical protein [Mycobacteriales bacterium]
MKNSHGRLTRARSAGLIAAGVVAGGVLAGTIGANAANSGSSGGGTASGTYSGSMAQAPPADAFGAAPVRRDEKQVASSIGATLKQKAEAKVPGASAYRVETDAGDGYYEVHMKRADGSLVTVKFDKSLDVTAVEDGMGAGDPGHLPGGRHGGRPGAPNGSTTPSGTAG